MRLDKYKEVFLPLEMPWLWLIVWGRSLEERTEQTACRRPAKTIIQVGSKKCTASICEKGQSSLRPLILLIVGQSQETTRVGWLKSLISVLCDEGHGFSGLGDRVRRRHGVGRSKSLLSVLRNSGQGFSVCWEMSITSVIQNPK